MLLELGEGGAAGESGIESNTESGAGRGSTGRNAGRRGVRWVQHDNEEEMKEEEEEEEKEEEEGGNCESGEYGGRQSGSARPSRWTWEDEARQVLGNGKPPRGGGGGGGGRGGSVGVGSNGSNELSASGSTGSVIEVRRLEDEEGEGSEEFWGLNSQSSLIGLIEKTEKGEWRVTDSGIIQLVGGVFLGGLFVFGVYLTASGSVHHKSPLYRAVGWMAVACVYGILIHCRLSSLTTRQRALLACFGVTLLLVGAAVMAFTGEMTLLIIAGGGPTSALVFRYILDLPEEL
jgi:hypothetical protein